MYPAKYPLLASVPSGTFIPKPVALLTSSQPAAAPESPEDDLSEKSRSSNSNTKVSSVDKPGLSSPPGSGVGVISGLIGSSVSPHEANNPSGCRYYGKGENAA